MRDFGVEGKSPSSFKVETINVDSKAMYPRDLVARGFDKGRIKMVLALDITYLRIGVGFFTNTVGHS
ncbi:MAG: hypothetical protein M0019_00345 [Actinomycetota bacterium]|nr:hypothetical protein [Actinomycetota bacterium]